MTVGTIIKEKLKNCKCGSDNLYQEFSHVMNHFGNSIYKVSVAIVCGECGKKIVYSSKPKENNNYSHLALISTYNMFLYNAIRDWNRFMEQEIDFDPDNAVDVYSKEEYKEREMVYEELSESVDNYISARIDKDGMAIASNWDDMGEFLEMEIDHRCTFNEEFKGE